ncbi:MAG: hypothetical protein Q9M30_03190 [Mariprofundaceae bacterium]|nr:hypothetical protein [Mariprofundaceae bacterium]
MSFLRRILSRLLKPYQLMVLEPEGGNTVRNMRVNLAVLLALTLILCLGSAFLAWHYAPPRSEMPSARFYQLQQQNHDLRDRLATLKGEISLSTEQVAGLKNELLAAQQTNEELNQAKTIYQSILEARKTSGVRILRASARIEANGNPAEGKQLRYSIVLVKGGNYPRSVTGSLLISAIGADGQTKALNLGKDHKGLPYHMETHVFLEGSVVWKEEWSPAKLHIIRLNYQGAKRDQMDVSLAGSKFATEKIAQ